MTHKLSKLKVQTCGDLQKVSVATLRQEFGPKTGETLHLYSQVKSSPVLAFIHNPLKNKDYT